MNRQFFTLFVPAALLICAFSCSGISETQEPPPPPPKPATVEEALTAYYSGRVEEAAADFESMLAEGVGGTADPRIKRQLAIVYRELGNYEGALKLSEELLESAGEKTANATELKRELFIDYCRAGLYDKAGELRKTLNFAGIFNNRKRAEILFYDALLLREQRRTKEAAALYKESLELDKYRPIAWYHLGLLLVSENPKEAEECFRTCLNQDSAFSEAMLPLGRLLMERKAWGQAADMLTRAGQRFPGDREIAAALAEVRKRVPGQQGDGLGAVRRTISDEPPKVKNMPVAREGTIRVGLAEWRTLVSVKAGGDFRINVEGAGIVYRGSAGDQIWITWREGTGNGTLIIQDEDNKVLIRSTKALVFTYNDPENTSIVAGVVSGSPGINRTYRGVLIFRPGAEGMTVVNSLNMEEYLYAVVPSEMPAGWPREALKAQAIAARSYSIANKGQFSERGFDLYGTPHSMAYQGVGIEHKNTTAAVDATRGMILKGGEEPLKAYFSANHGGYSEDCQTMWGYDAYMAAVPDKLFPVRDTFLPLDELDSWIRETPASFSFVSRFSYVSSYRWEKWVSPGEIRRRLSQDPGEIVSIISRGRGISGRIYELEVRGDKGSVMVKGDSIWNAMGSLRSSLFTIGTKRNKDGEIQYFVFQGAGHGHGIGMDQHGAAGMANGGYKAEEILLHYYPRAELVRL